MIEVDYGNVADELIHAMTHGPIPGGIQEWEVIESGYDADNAFAILLVDGKTFRMTMEEV